MPVLPQAYSPQRNKVIKFFFCLLQTKGCAANGGEEKTQSNRNVYLSDEELALIGYGQPNEYIVPLVPSSITTNFSNIRKRLGLEHIRFHDLRVYFASIMVAMGASEATLAHLGGWKEGSTALRDHYKKSIQSIDEGYAKKMNDYFTKIKNV